MPALPFATGFYIDSQKPIASQECTNLRVQVPETNALSRAQLKWTEGLDLFATAGTKICRGFHVMGGIAYSVNGNELFRVNSDGTTTSLGAIVGAGRVSMADNGTQLCIVVPSSTGYIYTVSGGLVAITDTDYTTSLGPSEGVAFKDGLFIHYNNNSAASNQPIIFVSNLNNGMAYDPLDFGTAEADPDKITALHVNQNQLYVGGRKTIEPFQNVGGADFPYIRVRGALIQKGITNNFCVVDFDNSFVFLGAGENEHPAIWRFSGNSSSRISTSSIDFILGQMTDGELDDVYAMTYAKNGAYYAIFQLKDRTFVYDANASALAQKPIWHERKSKDEFGQLQQWRVNHIAHAYGETLVGDNQGASIGRLSDTIFSEYGVSINRAFSTQPFDNDGMNISVSELQLLCVTGTAGVNDEDQHVSMSFSDDGGRTYGNTTKRHLGAQGDYNIKQIWRKCGQFRNTRIYRFSTDSKIDGAFIKLMAKFR